MIFLTNNLQIKDHKIISKNNTKQFITNPKHVTSRLVILFLRAWREFIPQVVTNQIHRKKQLIISDVPSFQTVSISHQIDLISRRILYTWLLSFWNDNIVELTRHRFQTIPLRLCSLAINADTLHYSYAEHFPLSHNEFPGFYYTIVRWLNDSFKSSDPCDPRLEISIFNERLLQSPFWAG